MGIFNKSDQLSVNRANATIIADGTEIREVIRVESNLHVDDKFSGTINSKSIIPLGKNGFIEGDIFSKKLTATGCFVGTTHCDEIEILCGGKVVGQITSNVLVIERGGFFEGESRPKESIKVCAARQSGEYEVASMNSKPKVTKLDIGFTGLLSKTMNNHFLRGG